MKNHSIWMLVGCIVPMLLIFLLPALGVSNTITTVVFIVLMLGCHLFMGHHMGVHGEQHDEPKQHKPD
jgi:cell division protein FtsW (lipid II flippase)